jgi:hypothetical protein
LKPRTLGPMASTLTITPLRRLFLLLQWGEATSIWNRGQWRGQLSFPSQRTRSNTCPSATLSTTNPTWTALGLNTGSRSVKPATNHLSYGKSLDTVQVSYLQLLVIIFMVIYCGLKHLN